MTAKSVAVDARLVAVSASFATSPRPVAAPAISVGELFAAAIVVKFCGLFASSGLNAERTL